MDSRVKQIYLSAPHATDSDIQAVVDAMRSGWLAPVGPDLTGFEQDMADYLGASHAVGLSSGTAALHLALQYLGVGPGDHVLVPTVTFGATAFAVAYLGAVPVFVDIDESWNMDPESTRTAIRALESEGVPVAAAVPVDLYGTTADYNSLLPLFGDHGIPVVEDSAEALGARHGERLAGVFGPAGVLSFNGNKLITTSGGGMLVTADADMADRVRFWSTQAREPLPWYEHEEIGFNYRMSNLLAALGRSQLSRVEGEVDRRRRLRERYRDALHCVPGVTVQEDPTWGRSNAWLTVVRFDPKLYPNAPRIVREALETARIESRPVWKPMHQQPVFSSSRSFLTGAADALFADGLCLPSGAGVDDGVVDEVSRIVLTALR